ncbi:hypothetical protein GGI20_002637 [Coemansia sp. BCRC 34301]|nr:hypothetical protein GGI20_002637 [Coemansia sp. BCRC 34301]
MAADADCVSGTRIGGRATAGVAATLPRSFRPSSLLRRRLADTSNHDQVTASGLRLSMPLAGDTLDFLDFSAFISGGGGGAAAEDSMLQALLSSLPEPPASTTSKPQHGGGTVAGQKRRKRESADTGGSLDTTPASSRRNTDEVDLPRMVQPQASADSLISASTTVGCDDMRLATESPPVSPFFARVAATDITEARDAIRRHTYSGSHDWRTPASFSRLSLEDISLANVCRNPLISKPAGKVRWFCVSVYGLLTEQTAYVRVAEMGSPVEISDPDVRQALRRYPLVLALAARQQQMQTPTRICEPRKNRRSLFSLPTMSFTVCSSGSSDRAVRAVDVEAMGAAYLPHVHRLLDESVSAPAEQVAGNWQRTPSESSTSTLADNASSEPSKPIVRSLLRQPQRRSDSGATDTLPRPQLRTSASVMNLRGAFTQPQRQSTASMGQPVSRRRSEVQALITQANAVIGGSRHTAEPQTMPRALRPPRASFPLDASLSGLRAPTVLTSPSLSAALSRQQHRLEPARCDRLRHSMSSSDVMRSAGGTPFTGIRPPPQSARSVSRKPVSAGPSRLRHSGPSSAALRQAYCESDLQAKRGAPVLRSRPPMHAMFSGCDDGFLTLRPVHTPDLVPRTIDPRLVERAMTPMLKTNIGIQYSSLVDLVRSSATIARDEDLLLPTLPEVSPAAEALPQSRFSPINSPERSPALAPANGRSSKPGFLARYRAAKQSTAPLPVSAIPLPPATPIQSRVLGLSNIPTLRKARSLWAMRSTPSQK